MKLSPRRYENRVVFLAFLLYGCLLFDRYAILFLLPALVQEFGLTQVEVGAIIAVQALGWGLSGWFFGSVSDRVGRRAVLIPGTLLFSILSAVTGLVTSVVQLLAARFVMSATAGATALPLFATVAAESSDKRRGLNQGLVTSAGTLVGFVIGPVVVTQLSAGFGWRWTFALVGLPGLLLALVIWRFLREPRRGEIPLNAPLAAQLRQLLRERNMRLSLATGTLLGIYTGAVGAFLPVYLTTTGYHLDSTTMGAVVGVGGIGTVLGIIVLPLISDRRGRKPVLVLAFALLTLEAWLIPIIGSDPARLAIVLAVLSLGYGAFPIALFVVPMESAPLAVAATAAALPGLCVEVFGGALGPIVAGAGADAIGASFPLWLGGAAAFVGLLVTPFYRESAPIKRRAPVGEALAPGSS
jgi:MFS family permease